jgi:potassium-dependent mechanosensitive channel
MRGPTTFTLGPPSHAAAGADSEESPFPLLVPFLLGILLVAPFPATVRGAQASATPKTTSQTPANTASPQATEPLALAPHAIPLTQIADRAEESDRQLQEISSQLMPKGELLEAARKTEEQTKEIHERVLQTEDLLDGAPAPLELEDELRYWNSRSSEFTAERKSLTAQAAKLEGQTQMLEVKEMEWQATFDQFHNISGIKPILDRIQQVLNRIRTTRAQAQDHLNLMLTLQNQVSQQDQQISDTLLRVRQARERKRSSLFEPDSRPLWESRELRQAEPSAPTFHHSFDRSLGTADEFWLGHKTAAFLLVLGYSLALLGTYKLRRYVVGATEFESSAKALQVLRAPFSVALLIGLMGTGEILTTAPLGIAFLFYLLYLIPVLRLLTPMLEPRMRSLLYLLSAFYAIEGLYLLVQLPPVLRREVYALIVAVALAGIGWLGRPSRLALLQMEARGLRILVIRTGLVLLIGSLASNIFGYVSLAQVLGLIVLVGPFVAAALFCGARVLSLILITVLHTNWARALSEERRNAVERWSNRVLAVGALTLWLRAMLQLLTLYDPVKRIVLNLLESPIGTEKVNFTLGGTLTVLLILLVGYVLANAFNLLLQKFVLPRLPLQRGIPYAISTVTYYIFLFLIAVAALTAAGVELNKFTVLTGALGVGLGFGLQNIVNNFVSGLILLFERPIHVGDTVDVQGLVGTVRRIGARSSTVLTYQGAEVIVPNSNLLSNQVINWTLSSPWRRVDVPVGVAYGTDPESVIKLLLGVAKAHPDVLLVRPPTAFFLGFGESALNFELRFWCAQQDLWLQLRSEVAIAVNKAFCEAGIEIPFPQRDLHIRSMDASATESIRNNAAMTPLSNRSGGSSSK